jgi:hypothetical protein
MVRPSEALPSDYGPTVSVDIRFQNLAGLTSANVDPIACGRLFLELGAQPEELNRLHIYLRPDYDQDVYSGADRRALWAEDPNYKKTAASTEMLPDGTILIDIGYGTGHGLVPLLLHEAEHVMRLLVEPEPRREAIRTMTLNQCYDTAYFGLIGFMLAGRDRYPNFNTWVEAGLGAAMMVGGLIMPRFIKQITAEGNMSPRKQAAAEEAAADKLMSDRILRARYKGAISVKRTRKDDSGGSRLPKAD